MPLNGFRDSGRGAAKRSIKFDSLCIVASVQVDPANSQLSAKVHI